MVTAGGRPPLPGACPAAGTGSRAAGPFLPGQARPAPHCSTLPQPGPARRAAEDRCGAAPAASRAQRCPNTPPTPAPEAAARTGGRARSDTVQTKLLTGKARLPGARSGSRLPAPQPRVSSALLGPLREPGARRPRLGRELPPPPQISWQEANSGQDFTSQPPLLPSRGQAPWPSRPTRHAPGPIGGRTGREGAEQRVDPPIRGLRGRAKPGPSHPG